MYTDASTSKLSLSSMGSENEDWDRSMSVEPEPESSKRTPRNSIAFPANGVEDQGEATPGRLGGQDSGMSKRTLSELLKIHAEKGTDVKFTPEEAARVAEVLGQWINSSCSPYEAEDDFFSRPQSQDDSSIAARRSPSVMSDISGRPRGQSESVVKNV